MYIYYVCECHDIRSIPIYISGKYEEIHCIWSIFLTALTEWRAYFK